VREVEADTFNDASLPTDRRSPARRVARVLVPPRLRPAVASVVRPLRYRGDAVHCTVCGGHFSRFLPHQDRPFALCPSCEALERHRLLVSYLRERTDLFTARLKVLHMAPEWCLQRVFRRIPSLDYVSADLDSPIAMDQVDLLDLPYAAGSFDVVICNHVLEHVDDDRRALDEIRRVLRPDGRAILMSPIDDACSSTIEDPSVNTPEQRHRVYGQHDHLRRYGRDFGERVAEQGFNVDTIRYVDQLGADQIEHEGLRRDGVLFAYDDIFICRPTAHAPG
jgi:predicted SAM-dependent methyltransferase